MNSAEREIIDHYSPEITRDAIPVDMLPYLPCLTQSDKEIIAREETNKGPMRATIELLSRVRRRRGAFRELVFALRASGCGHVADLLHPEEQEDAENENPNNFREEDVIRPQADREMLFLDQVPLDDINST